VCTAPNERGATNLGASSALGAARLVGQLSRKVWLVRPQPLAARGAARPGAPRLAGAVGGAALLRVLHVDATTGRALRWRVQALVRRARVAASARVLPDLSSKARFRTFDNNRKSFTYRCDYDVAWLAQGVPYSEVENLHLCTVFKHSKC
jgi:hypothetical protein